MESFFNIDEQAIEFAKSFANVKDPAIVEKLVGELKSKGYSQLQTVFILLKAFDITFQHANSIVLNSKAWNL